MTTKTQRIRDYVAKHPEKTAKEVAEALKEYEISAQYVYSTLYKSRMANQGGSNANTIERLKAAKDFADLCGGMDNAIEILGALKELTD